MRVVAKREALLRVSNRLFLLDYVDAVTRPMLVDIAYEYHPTPYVCHLVELRDSHRGQVITAN